MPLTVTTPPSPAQAEKRDLLKTGSSSTVGQASTAFSKPDQACSEPRPSERDFLAILKDKNNDIFDFSASAKILIRQLEDKADSTIKDDERQALEG